MTDAIVFPGQVEWSGENPGISLKQQADGPFTTLASFFRVVLSPHGRGHALVLLRSPQEADPAPERANICLHDNEPLARYLVTEFVSQSAPSAACPACEAWPTGRWTASRPRGTPAAPTARPCGRAISSCS